MEEKLKIGLIVFVICIAIFASFKAGEYIREQEIINGLDKLLSALPSNFANVNININETTLAHELVNGLNQTMQQREKYSIYNRMKPLK